MTMIALLQDAAESSRAMPLVELGDRWIHFMQRRDTVAQLQGPELR